MYDQPKTFVELKPGEYVVSVRPSKIIMAGIFWALALLGAATLLLAVFGCAPSKAQSVNITSGLTFCTFGQNCSTSSCSNDEALRKAVSLQLLDWWGKAPDSLSRSELASKQSDVDRVRKFADALDNECYRGAYQSWLSTAQFALSRRKSALDLEDAAKALLPNLPQGPK